MDKPSSFKDNLLLKGLVIAVILSLAYYLIFVLPYSIPTKFPSESLSYSFGFNNKIAVIGTLFIIFVFVTAGKLLKSNRFLSSFRLFSEKGKEGAFNLNMSFWVCATIYFVFSLFCFFVFNNPHFRGEGDYFIRTIDLLEMGKLPYKDFWCHFGPGVIYIPFFIKKMLCAFGATTRTSYYIFHGLMNLLSLYMLYFLTNKFNIQQKYRSWIFVSMALLQLNFSMGVQYTFIRTLTPFFFLLLLNGYMTDDFKAGSTAKNIILSLLPFLLFLMILPMFVEVGIAFGVTLAIYLFAFSSTNKNKKSFVYLISYLVCILLIALFVPRDIFQDTLDAMGGGQNFPIFPSPYVLIYLFSLFFSMPLLINGNSSGGDNDKPVNISYAALCVFLMPGAFGRCDAGHVFYFGIGTFIVTAAILAKTSIKAFKAYMLAFIITFAFCLCSSGFIVSAGKITASLYAQYGKYLFSDEQIMNAASTLGLNKNKVSTIIEYEKSFSNYDYSPLDKYPSLATPLIIDSTLYNHLLKTGKFVPEYYLYMITVDTDKKFMRKVSDLNRSEYLIVSKLVLKEHQTKPNPSLEDRAFSILLCFPVKIPHKIPPLNFEEKFTGYILARYKMVDEFGQYIIFQKKK